MTMIRIFILVILLTPIFHATSQGGWNIGYIEIDSISAKDAGKSVKIDFKQKHIVNKEKKNRSVRQLVEPKDTGQITLGGNAFELVERRKIYADWGYYQEQYLECPGYENNRLVKVYDSEILQVKKDSILFRLHLEIYNKRKDKATGEPVRDTVLSWIEKEKLDGVIIKK